MVIRRTVLLSNRYTWAVTEQRLSGLWQVLTFPMHDRERNAVELNEHQSLLKMFSGCSTWEPRHYRKGNNSVVTTSQPAPQFITAWSTSVRNDLTMRCLTQRCYFFFHNAKIMIIKDILHNKVRLQNKPQSPQVNGLLSWEENWAPSCINALEKYCKLFSAVTWS